MSSTSGVVYIQGVAVPLRRINISSIGSPAYITLLGKPSVDVQAYLRWVEAERLALQSSELADPAQRQPIRMWRVGQAGGVMSAQDYHQISWLQVQAFVGADSSLEIPLVDSEDKPLIDPSLMPLIETRFVRIGDTDLVKDDGSGATGGWTDRFAEYRSSEQWLTTPAVPVASFLRLVRDPNPHLVLTITCGHFQRDGTSPTVASDKTVVVNMLGIGGVDTAEKEREVGSAGVPGHYKWYRNGGGGAGAWSSGPTPLGVYAGGQTAYGTHRWGVCGNDNVAAAGSANVYAAVGGVAGGAPLVGGAAADVPHPFVRVRAISAPNGAATLGTPTTWVQDTRHRGFDEMGALGDPPIHGPNVQLAEYWSDLVWDGANSRWYVHIDNSSSYPRSFAAWWAGR